MNRLKRYRFKFDYTDYGIPLIEFSIQQRTIISATVTSLILGVIFTIRALSGV